MSRLQIAPRALVCKNSTIEGDVRIGNGTVVHVGATIIGKGGPVIIGCDNIINEKAVIVNLHSTPLVIGDANLFETEAYVEGRGIGHRNVVQVRAKVLGESTVGNNCVIGAGCQTHPDEDVPDNTVLFGNPQFRRTRTDGNLDQIAVHKKHLEYIHEMLPRYNHIVETD